MKKKLLIIFIILVILIAGFFLLFSQEKKEKYSLFKVLPTTISQIVSETGTIKMGEEIKLGFKSGGKIENIFVQMGKKVKEGEELAKLDNSQVFIQLNEAEAHLEAQKIKLEELKKGPRSEEIEISKTILEKAENDLNNFYNETITVLNQSYNLTDKIIRQEIVNLFFYRAEANIPYYELTYKHCQEVLGREVAFERKIIEEELNKWKTEIKNLTNQKQIIDEAIIKTNDYLVIFQNFLKKLNDTLIVTPNCLLTPQEIEKINNFKFSVNLAITNLNTVFNSVLTQKKLIDGQKLIVKNYQQELDLKLAGPTREQIAYQEALIKQGEARVRLFKEQIKDSVLRAPLSGQIIKINKKTGEIVQPGETVLTIISLAPFQIKTDIYEEDVVKIKLNNETEIKLTAFPSEIFKGKVIHIDPDAKLKEGIVYYEIIIDFEKIPEGIKPGMTVDIAIKTQFKENILAVPKSAIEERNGKKFVKILKEKNIIEKEIELGIEGSDDLVEVVFGLTEGEEVILK